MLVNGLDTNLVTRFTHSGHWEGLKHTVTIKLCVDKYAHVSREVLVTMQGTTTSRFNSYSSTRLSSSVKHQAIAHRTDRTDTSTLHRHGEEGGRAKKEIKNYRIS